MSVLDQIIKTAMGAKLLAEWLGEGGKPVEKDKAWTRAKICSMCPKKEYGNWWDHVKDWLANKIRSTIAIKRTLDLKTPYDETLGTCLVCTCVNSLAVWVPIEHIKNHTDTETYKKFPDNCWKKQEIKDSV